MVDRYLSSKFEVNLFAGIKKTMFTDEGTTDGRLTPAP